MKYLKPLHVHVVITSFKLVNKSFTFGQKIWTGQCQLGQSCRPDNKRPASLNKTPTSSPRFALLPNSDQPSPVSVHHRRRRRRRRRRAVVHQIRLCKAISSACFFFLQMSFFSVSKLVENWRELMVGCTLVCWQRVCCKGVVFVDVE